MSTPNLNYYRLKFSYQAENADGAITTVKEETLVQAGSYTEAESLAVGLQQNLPIVGDNAVEYEIIRTKIAELAYNDTCDVQPENNLIADRKFFSYWLSEEDSPETGLYAVSLIYNELDEKTGKEKHSSDTIYIPAFSSKDAIENANKYLKAVGETRDWTIRNVKYDKAQSVLVDPETHQQNMRVYDNY